MIWLNSEAQWISFCLLTKTHVGWRYFAEGCYRTHTNVPYTSTYMHIQCRSLAHRYMHACIEVECFKSWKSTKFQRWSSTTHSNTLTHTGSRSPSAYNTHMRLYSEKWLYKIAKWRHPHTIAYKCIIIYFFLHAHMHTLHAHTPRRACDKYMHHSAKLAFYLYIDRYMYTFSFYIHHTVAQRKFCTCIRWTTIQSIRKRRQNFTLAYLFIFRSVT